MIYTLKTPLFVTTDLNESSNRYDFSNKLDTKKINYSNLSVYKVLRLDTEYTGPIVGADYSTSFSPHLIFDDPCFLHFSSKSRIYVKLKEDCEHYELTDAEKENQKIFSKVKVIKGLYGELEEALSIIVSESLGFIFKKTYNPNGSTLFNEEGICNIYFKDTDFSHDESLLQQYIDDFVNKINATALPLEFIKCAKTLSKDDRNTRRLKKLGMVKVKTEWG